MDSSYKFKKLSSSVSEGIASEHPDTQGQENFQKRADDILKRRKDARERTARAKELAAKNAKLDAAGKRIREISTIRREEFELGEEKDHEYSMARGELNTASDAIQRLKKRLKGEGQLEAWIQSKITKATDYLRSASDYIESGESQVNEEHMTKSDIKKEEKLKKKYDPSGMKASMIKQYGPEKGKEVYFATIRKQAMKEALELEEVYKELPIKKMLNKAGEHKFFGGWVQGEFEGNRRNAQQKKPRVKALVDLANKRAKSIHDTIISHNPEEAKAKSRLKEFYELDEAKLSRAERRAGNSGKKGYDTKGNPTAKGGIHAFDVDETLFSHGVKGKPNVKVHVNDTSGKRVESLTNQQFNTHKLPKGHSYDFSEFRSAGKFSQTASPNKKVIKQLRRLQRRGKNVHLITARDKFDKPEEFRQHFARHGIKISPGNIHYAGGMKGSDIGKKKVDVAKGLAKIGKTSSVHMYDDAAKVHKAFEAEKGKSPGLKIKTHLAKPNKKGEVMTRSYQATKEEFELWVNALIDEGYDLSDFTVDELIEAYSEVLDEAITAVAAPGEDGKSRPIKKGPRPLDYKSPYNKNKKTYKEEVKELTPYEFWKNFIGEDKDEESQEETIEESVEMVEKPLTSYDYWKAKIEEQAGSEDRGERHVAHDVAMKKRDPNQKTTIIPTASRPGNSPSLNLPMSSVPHVHTPNSKAK